MAIRASAHPVAFSEALDLLHWEMYMVLYHRIEMAIKTTSKVRVFVDCCLFVCCPGGHWGDTEQVVTWCWHPGAFGVSLVMLHQAMPSVSLQRTAMAIEMAGNGGTFACHGQFCHRPEPYPMTMLWSIKYKTELHYCQLVCLLLVCTMGACRRQWMPFWSPLLPADEPKLD